MGKYTITREIIENVTVIGDIEDSLKCNVILNTLK